MRLRDAVRIEIRAAAIAAAMICKTKHDMTLQEIVGFMRCGDNRERGAYPKSTAWQAGWLAAFIYGAELDDRRARRPRGWLPRATAAELAQAEQNRA